MDTLSILSTISAIITIGEFAKNFIKSIGLKSSPELESKVCEAIEDFKKTQQNDTASLMNVLSEIPQLAVMEKEHLQTQFENTLKEFSNSNVVQLKDSDGNQITQITQNHSGSGDNIQASGNIHSGSGDYMQASGNITKTYNYAPSAPEKPYQINDDKCKELIREFLYFVMQPPMGEKVFIEVKCFSVLGVDEYKIDDRTIPLALWSMYNLKDRHNLTKKECKMIFNIISDMTPKVIDKSVISTFSMFNSCKLFFVIQSMHSKLPIHREEIDSLIFQPCNKNSIPELLQKIQSGIMDDYIKTSIRELG